tara:strand:- start:1712 stop:2809 length:1098 start_codon:yes stop_codon:yes gene_type:complete
MEIIELLLDEENEEAGIDAISIVSTPAIESNFLAFKSQEIKFAKVDDEKRILMGAALIPNKPIYRKDEKKEYYVYFSADTVRKASELFFMNGNQNNTTLEHNMQLNGLTVVESWIVEGEQDKSRMYGLDVPVGTWMVSMKVNNDEVWNDYVKEDKVKGFSIEGYFADKANLKASVESVVEEVDLKEEEAKQKIEEIRNLFKKKRVELETYNDYPDALSNNAKRGIELNKKVNNKCATQVGKVRAQQLANKENISLDTIKRMYSYLSRAETYYDESNTKACGTISYLLWGGKAGLRWSLSKLKELDEINLESMVIDEDYAVIDDRLAYSTQAKAEEMAINIGCKGFHTHEFKNKTWYMPCEKHINK